MLEPATELEKILLITAAAGPSYLKQVLLAAGYQITEMLLSSADLGMRGRQLRADIVLVEVEAPSRQLLDRLYGEFDVHTQPVMIFAQNCEKSLIKQAMQLGIIVHLTDTLTPTLARSLLENACFFFFSHSRLEEEIEGLKQSLCQQKHIAQAKYLLMEEQGMTEEAAYEFLRNTSMNRSQRIVEVARGLVAAHQRREAIDKSIAPDNEVPE